MGGRDAEPLHPDARSRAGHRVPGHHRRRAAQAGGGRRARRRARQGPAHRGPDRGQVPHAVRRVGDARRHRAGEGRLQGTGPRRDRHPRHLPGLAERQERTGERSAARTPRGGLTMSVDCNAYLPVTTEASDIADAVAILLGAKVTMEPLDNYSDSVYAKVGGVEVDPSTITFAYANLSINATLQRKAYELARGAGVVEADASASLGLAPSLGLDVDRRTPALYVHLGSGPVRVAIAVRLAQFFGGSVVPQDSGAGKYE